MARKSGSEAHVWGGRAVAPGERLDLTLTASTSYSGTPIELPVQVWRGAKPGPAVFVTGAVHGDEINGTGTVRHIIQEEPFELVAGTLVLVPVVNISAFEQLSRYSPDRRDLNRSFPGSVDGSLSSRIAHVIFENVIARCDYGIDLHTAAVRRTNYPNVRADMEQEATARLATLFGAELLLNSKGPQGSLRRAALQVGCATITLEAGEVWKVEPAVVEYALRGIRNVLIGLKMVRGEVVKPSFRMVAEDTAWIRANEGGFLRFHVHPGDMVDEGQPLATNTSLAGRDLGVVVAPRDAIVLAMTTLPAVSPGDPVAHLAYSSEAAMRKMERALDKLPEDSLLTRLHDDLATNVMVSELDDTFG
ncbi:succinylglutamate desuccinylase/aspartoacylase family protein [Gaopeijia maritima]|uniref:Succinylglutamate desuccinylase/aspartoacylase family protein n=1 Tax=Gaopeijia maritima TaxID=3119007 RepID=A0ABU9E524_9BACT